MAIKRGAYRFDVIGAIRLVLKCRKCFQTPPSGYIIVLCVFLSVQSPLVITVLVRVNRQNFLLKLPRQHLVGGEFPPSKIQLERPAG